VAYTLTYSFTAPPGLTLEAQFVSTANANVGSAITTGFIEFGSGIYGWTGSHPDSHRGYVILRVSSGGTIHAVFAVNPEEAEKLFTGVPINLAQDVPAADVSAKTTSTVGDCLLASRAEAAGAESIVGTNQTKKNADGTTFRAFTLNDETTPTARS
jgi:hypothetical protein